ncbi:PQQ-dependent sugar dehydrogenase [Salinimicrobium terrae]|uniref:PQQ-dependent sugar dehydrogenase n=1 Tax=Salinimicrobium terrae TaxID=470866 RepID=UPI0004244754|nr:glucose dehydrogenase [Salinimicrobium terrae]
MKGHLNIILFLGILFLVSGCYRIMSSDGGGQLSYDPDRRNIDPADVLLPEGYEIEVVARDLTFPTAVTFDEQGTPYVIEAGYSYGEVFLEPKLLRVEPDGSRTTIFTGEINGPWNGVTYYNEHFFISEGGELKGGKILKVNKEGEAEVLVDGLPSLGDHHTNGPVIKEGYVYFGQGTATNSGVVGLDNAEFGWLYRYEDFHDIPCKDILVNPLTFETENVLTDASDDIAVTGPFSPYNKTVEPNQVIEGALPCTGAIMRIPVDGGDLELVAWGFRNPYGMAVAPDGEIYITQNSYDVRGSRPVWGTGDLLWKLEKNRWYGWPDYNGSHKITNLEVPGKDSPAPVMAQYPEEPPHPVATFGVHSSSNGISFSTNKNFGFNGQAFVAQFGDMAPGVGKVLAPVGFKVVRVDVDSGIVEEFAVNKAVKNGPATWLKSGGLERPVSVSFNPSGDALYIVDFGIMTMTDKGPNPMKKSGVIWKVTKQDQ